MLGLFIAIVVFALVIVIVFIGEIKLVNRYHGIF